MSTQTVERFASIDDSAFDVYEIRSRMFDTLNAIDPLLWIDLMNCDRLRGCPSYAAELLALDYARAIERKRPQTAEVLARFYHTDVRPFLNGYYLGMFDPQFPAQEVNVEPVKPTEEEVIASPEFADMNQDDSASRMHILVSTRDYVSAETNRQIRVSLHELDIAGPSDPVIVTQGATERSAPFSVRILGNWGHDVTTAWCRANDAVRAILPA